MRALQLEVHGVCQQLLARVVFGGGRWAVLRRDGCSHHEADHLTAVVEGRFPALRVDPEPAARAHED